MRNPPGDEYHRAERNDERNRISEDADNPQRADRRGNRTEVVSLLGVFFAAVSISVKKYLFQNNQLAWPASKRY